VLIPKPHLDGIRDGKVDLAFRRWTRPSVKAGGTLLTRIGRLRLGAVKTTSLRAISEADAKRAGYASRAELVGWLASVDDGDIYRIEIAAVEADPRVALRAAPPTADELATMLARLARLDEASSHGAWTRTVLALIDANPGVRALDLATQLGREKLPFKVDVRKLKAMGLTESLEVGYRLSPRGTAVLAALTERSRSGAPTRSTSPPRRSGRS
jgi:hypothetical protein